MGGDRWLRKKNIGLRFRCHAQIPIGGIDDRIICRDPASSDASHVFTTRVIRKDRLVSIQFIIVVKTSDLHFCYYKDVTAIIIIV
jgi:hypothetical protein